MQVNCPRNASIRSNSTYFTLCLISSLVKCTQEGLLCTKNRLFFHMECFLLKPAGVGSCIQVAQLSKALSNVPAGGQILLDSASFNSVCSVIPEIAKMLPPRPDFEALSKIARQRYLFKAETANM